MTDGNPSNQKVSFGRFLAGLVIQTILASGICWVAYEIRSFRLKPLERNTSSQFMQTQQEFASITQSLGELTGVVKTLGDKPSRSSLELSCPKPAEPAPVFPQLAKTNQILEKLVTVQWNKTNQLLEKLVDIHLKYACLYFNKDGLKSPDYCFKHPPTY